MKYFKDILSLNDSAFLKVIPQIMKIYSEILVDCQNKNQSQDSSSLDGQQDNKDDTLKILFFIFLRALSLVPIETIPQTIPITTLCDMLNVFLGSNTRVLIDHLEGKQDSYRNDLEKLIQCIFESIRKMEKGGGKKSSASSAVDFKSLEEMVTVLVNLSQIWPCAFGDCFWKIKSGTLGLLFAYESMSKLVVVQTGDDSIIKAKVRKSKEDLLLIISRLLEYKYFKPLCDGTLDDTEREAILNDFCDWVLILLDSSDMQGKVECFVNSPLLLDYEIFHGISDSIQTILASFHEQGKDFDTARIDYLLASLENIVTFSGNTQLRMEKRKKSVTLNMGLQPPSYSTSMMSNPNLSSEDHLKSMLNTSHVHDLFPDLGEGFIEECLKEFENDPELVVMALLENQLPLHLQNLDRSLPSKRMLLSSQQSSHELALVRTTSHDSIKTVVSEPSSNEGVDTAIASLQNLQVNGPDDKLENEVVQDQPMMNRRNVFDGDEYDVLAGKVVDKNLIYFGKKNKIADFDKERAEFMAQQKAAIIAAQFQTEDDEYDDTYDASDVKLTGIFDGEPLDSGTKKTPFDPFEKQLVEIFKTDPAFFHSSARKSKPRQELCQKLKWTNEQVEGWFIMFNRNPNKDEILDKYDKPENRPIDTQEENRSLPDSSPSSSNIRNRGRGGRGGGGRGKKRGQRVYKPPSE